MTMAEKKRLVWVVSGEDTERCITLVNGVYENEDDADAAVRKLAEHNRLNRGPMRWYRTQEVFNNRQ